jgi:hypothetical protein
MKYIQLIFLLFLISTYTENVKAQDFSAHKWEHRLVLILTDDTDNEKYNNQVEEMKNQMDGAKERRIVVYHITPEKLKVGLSDGGWQKLETEYARYKKTSSQPEIILIGLDGGVKLRAEEFLSNQKLFDTIDAMPMRMQEMRRKNNQ